MASCSSTAEQTKQQAANDKLATHCTTPTWQQHRVIYAEAAVCLGTELTTHWPAIGLIGLLALHGSLSGSIEQPPGSIDSKGVAVVRIT
jgi:hypothetical protein